MKVVVGLCEISREFCIRMRKLALGGSSSVVGSHSFYLKMAGEFRYAGLELFIFS